MKRSSLWLILPKYGIICNKFSGGDTMKKPFYLEKKWNDIKLWWGTQDKKKVFASVFSIIKNGMDTIIVEWVNHCMVIYY